MSRNPHSSCRTSDPVPWIKKSDHHIDREVSHLAGYTFYLLSHYMIFVMEIKEVGILPPINSIRAAIHPLRRSLPQSWRSLAQSVPDASVALK